MSSASTNQPDLSVVPKVWTRYTNLLVDHGEGSWLVTSDGKRYLDYSSGIGVTNTGHSHPRVVAAIQEQAAKLLHGQQNIVYHVPGLRLHSRLADLMPGPGWGAFLANSGAEAIEAAVKLARASTGRSAVIAFRGGFHGRTAQAMALTSSRVAIRKGYEPLPSSVYHVDYPYCYRSQTGSHTVEHCSCAWEVDLGELFAELVHPEEVAAMIVEPILGEGGYVVPPVSFLARLREITRARGILLICDEVQTGFGRTGRFFAWEHSGAVPDIVVVAKGIASGLPLSGIIARRDVLAGWAPGSHGGTFGGNVVACAAALATLDVIEDEGLIVNARERGNQLFMGCSTLRDRHPALGDVRGRGCMIGLEFVHPGDGNPPRPNPELAHRVLDEALARQLILLSAGTYGQVVRCIPPLVTTAAEIDRALNTLEDALTVAGA